MGKSGRHTTCTWKIRWSRESNVGRPTRRPILLPRVKRKLGPRSWWDLRRSFFIAVAFNTFARSLDSRKSNYYFFRLFSRSSKERSRADEEDDGAAAEASTGAAAAAAAGAATAVGALPTPSRGAWESCAERSTPISSRTCLMTASCSSSSSAAPTASSTASVIISSLKFAGEQTSAQTSKEPSRGAKASSPK
eukprot:GHVT01070733.1.p1 GENE.GHVT01070733.1~~GHVT01070733.1.p1  ORF type:complete len:193 (+),score=29.78 GHVT01070733.1:854-1432(+)